MPAFDWKDETSYSRADKTRVPAVYTFYITGRFRLRLCVHRWHGIADTWFFTCSPFAEKKELKAKTADDAKREAEKFFRVCVCELSGYVRTLELAGE